MGEENLSCCFLLDPFVEGERDLPFSFHTRRTRGVSDGVTVLWGWSGGVPSSHSPWALRASFWSHGGKHIASSWMEYLLGRLGRLPGDSTLGWPHHSISVSCFQFFLPPGAPVLSEVNEIIVTGLPLNYRGCCFSFPTCTEEAHQGAWQPHYLMAPEPGFLRSGGFLRLFSAPQSGRRPWAGPAAALKYMPSMLRHSAHNWHTLMRLWFASLPSPPPLEYKKKYGEEHGSCQAGIAGFFTEVGITLWAFLFSHGCSFPAWLPIIW